MKGVRIPDDLREEALELYASGLSYAEIEAKTGVSRASMSGIVQEAARKDPNFKILEEVARHRRENAVSDETLLRAVRLDERVESSGSNWDDIEKFVLPLVEKYGPLTSDVCEKGIRYSKVRDETGKDIPELEAELRGLPIEIKKLSDVVAKLEGRNTELENQIESREPRLRHVEDLETIDTSLKKIHMGPRDAAKILSKSEFFWKMGLTESVMDTLVAELSKIGFKDKDGATRVADLVKKHGTLEEAAVQEARLLEKLRVETAKMISDRSLYGEKVAALKKRCHELELRGDRLSNESASMETSFKERRKELDRKLTVVEEEIKASTTRLSELQSQIIGLEKQITEKEAELRGLASQKVSEQKALSDLEAKKRDASVDYQTVIRALGGLRGELAELKRTYSELEAEYNRKAGVYQNEISRLKGQVLTLQNEESGLNKAIAESKEALDRIGEAIEKNAYLFVLVSIVGGKEPPLKPAKVLEPILSVLEAYRGYIEKHQREIPGSAEMIVALTRLTTLLVEVIRFGNR